MPWTFDRDAQPIWRGARTPPADIEDVYEVAEYLGDHGYPHLSEPEDWMLKCAEVAGALVRTGLVEGTERYGHYRGPVNPASPFARLHYTTGWTQHGWVEMKHGILDPTRWTFTDPDEPLIEFIDGPMVDQYDVGGNKFRARTKPAAPAFGASGRIMPLALPAATARFVHGQLNHAGPPGQYDVRQVHWLATLPPSDLGAHAAPLFRAIIAAGGGGFIPLDNKRLVLK